MTAARVVVAALVLVACAPPSSAPASACDEAWTRAYVLELETCKLRTTSSAELDACTRDVARRYAGRFGATP